MPDDLLRDDTDICAMRWTGNLPVTLHQHEFIEIAFLAQGSCIHLWQDTEVRLVPGDVFLIGPHEDHAYRIEGQTVIYNCLFYPASLGEDWVKLQQEKGFQQLLFIHPREHHDNGRQALLHLGTSDAERLENLWQDMIRETGHDEMEARLALKAQLTLLLILLGRAWKGQFTGLSGLYDARRTQLADVLAFMDQHTADAFSLDQLAAQCCVSPGHFRRLFKETTGLSPLEYIHAQRISLAQRKLCDRSLSIAQVGAAVGMTDPNYFARWFKKHVGCTPVAFRERQSGD